MFLSPIFRNNTSVIIWFIVDMTQVFNRAPGHHYCTIKYHCVMTVKFSSDMTFSKIAMVKSFVFLMDPSNRPTKNELCRFIVR